MYPAGGRVLFAPDALIDEGSGDTSCRQPVCCPPKTVCQAPYGGNAPRDTAPPQARLGRGDVRLFRKERLVIEEISRIQPEWGFCYFVEEETLEIFFFYDRIELNLMRSRKSLSPNE